MQGFVYRLHTVIHIGKQVTVPISKALKDSTILQTDALIKRPHEDKEELRMNDEEWISVFFLGISGITVMVTILVTILISVTSVTAVRTV